MKFFTHIFIATALFCSQVSLFGIQKPSEESKFGFFDAYYKKRTFFDVCNFSISAIDIARDGTFLVVGSNNGVIKVWDIESREERLCLNAHTSEVTGVKISSSGKFLASCSKDKSIKWWDLATGNIVWTLMDENELRFLALSKNDQMIAVGLSDSTIKIWNVISQELLYIRKKSNSELLAISFSQENNDLWAVFKGPSSINILCNLECLNQNTKEAFLLDKGIDELSLSILGNHKIAGVKNAIFKTWIKKSFPVSIPCDYDDSCSLGKLTSSCFSFDGAKVFCGTKEGRIIVFTLLSSEEIEEFKCYLNSFDE